MTAWRHPGCWLAWLGVLFGGVAVVATRDNTLRETAFTLLMFAALASSLNIMMGYTGYVNFGHIVFFGLGGYVGFYLISQHGWSLYPAVLAAGLSSGLLAWLLGSAILRLRGAYFALATIGINEAARAFVNNFTPFGGPTGLSVDFAAYKTYGGAAQALWLTYAMLLFITVLTLIASAAVKHSRFGLGLMAIREDEDAAMMMGVSAPRFKTVAYALSAVSPGMVGTLCLFKNGNVEPGDVFRLNMSIELLVMVMLGGQGTVLGPVLGAVTYERLRGYLLTSSIFKNLHLAVAGLALLLIVLFVPAGVVGWLRNRFPRLRGLLV